MGVSLSMRYFRRSAMLTVSAGLCFTCFSGEKVIPEVTGRLVVATGSGEVLYLEGEEWLKKSLPIGSLVKPFTALAAIETDPSLACLVVNCQSTSPSVPVGEGCWYRPGHGSLGLSQALALSCDRYFHLLASRTSPSIWKKVLTRYGLSPPEETSEIISEMVGTGEKLQATPLEILGAYLTLVTGLFYRCQSAPSGHWKFLAGGPVPGNEQARHLVDQGLAGCLSWGTGSNLFALGDVRPAGKTGTVSFSLTNRPGLAGTHGWFVGFWPGENPEVALVVFLLEGRGSDAARAGCNLFQQLRARGIISKTGQSSGKRQ
ncbi:MAG TPA: penicillin-binding transpeptidase domain-containing protein [bacterium]|nr:penicillin-binding transpeptidase domain-containing protein [bacterium]HOL67355.1 penicillin-binding transpeptidase domain-containing protein [bacterium]